MTIRESRRPPTSSVLVIVMKKGEAIGTHPFVRALSSADMAYLRAFVSRTSGVDDGAHTIILPSEKTVLLIGGGEKNTFTHRKAILLARKIITAARSERLRTISVALSDFLAPRMKAGEVAGIIATQCEIANFEFTVYKTKPEGEWSFIDVVVVVHGERRSLRSALRRGKVVGEEMNNARTLSNTPGGDMTPRTLAEAARKTGKATGFRVRILDDTAIRRFKMGGVLGVSRGSAEPPCFIVMEYWGARNAASHKRGEPRPGAGREKPVVLVGKGVTFDTGGLNLKPEQGIYEMHMDMSGGAAVIHIIAALARLGVKKNIVGLVPAVENMPSGSSYHPGDLLKTMSGKTIEVLNTDAEGRVILADALTYAKRYTPRLIIDIATLTGAAEVALGQRASALFTTSEPIGQRIQDIGERTGDFVWPLPLWEEYEEDIKGTFGDWANTGKTKYGGAITGAVFLWQFVKGTPWVHIDMAPRMTALEGEYLAKGAAGATIALFTRFLEEF